MVRDMKIRKNSEQRNFVVDVRNMLYKDLIELLNDGTCEIFYTQNFEHVENYEEVELKSCQYTIRIFTCYCNEIKVAYDNLCGRYQTVAITKDGRKVAVVL